MARIIMVFFIAVCSVAACSSFSSIKNDKSQKGKSKSLPSPFPKEVNPDEYVFYFGDEFNDTRVDTAIWNRRWRLPTDKFSQDPNSLNTIKVSDGKLSMSTSKSNNGEVGSAEISTDKHFWLRYGYLELRAQLSSGVGHECAFWLQTPKTLEVTNPFNPAIAGAEIDIFENGIAKGINKLYYSLHWNGYNPPHAKFVTFEDSIPGVYSGFHTFAFEWTPRKYTVFVDGVKRLSSDTIISHMPEFVILGIGPGGYGGDAAIFPNPSNFLVDYLRVYQRRPEVTLFTGPDYRGHVSYGLLPGSYTREQLITNGTFDNDISSIEVPVNWRVILYDKDKFTGDSLVIDGGDIYNLDRMDNKTSSLRIVAN